MSHYSPKTLISQWVFNKTGEKFAFLLSRIFRIFSLLTIFRKIPLFLWEIIRKNIVAISRRRQRMGDPLYRVLRQIRMRKNGYEFFKKWWRETFHTVDTVVVVTKTLKDYLSDFVREDKQKKVAEYFGNKYERWFVYGKLPLTKEEVKKFPEEMG